MNTLGLFERKCDYAEEKIQGQPVNMYSSTFCSNEHVARYFGAYVDETSDEVYWSDFY